MALHLAMVDRSASSVWDTVCEIVLDNDIVTSSHYIDVAPPPVVRALLEAYPLAIWVRRCNTRRAAPRRSTHRRGSEQRRAHRSAPGRGGPTSGSGRR